MVLMETSQNQGYPLLKSSSRQEIPNALSNETFTNFLIECQPSAARLRHHGLVNFITRSAVSSANLPPPILQFVARCYLGLSRLSNSKRRRRKTFAPGLSSSKNLPKNTLAANPFGLSTPEDFTLRDGFFLRGRWMREPLGAFSPVLNDLLMVWRKKDVEWCCRFVCCLVVIWRKRVAFVDVHWCWTIINLLVLM